ncbi:uncharacterized protein DS421_7g213140 [Arachis hypogaea]|nr:uncharacterized protein DS421_7g213140 [Arachis hypogaea]
MQLEALNLDLCSSRYRPLKGTWSGCLVGVVMDNAPIFQVGNVPVPSLPKQGNEAGVVDEHSFSSAHWQRARAFLKAPCLLPGVGNVHGMAYGRWQRAWHGLWALAT